MAERPAPRARGRARGRARQTQEETPISARGPPPAQASAAAAHPSGVTGGRKYHRGVPRTDVEELTRGVASVEVGGESMGRARGAARRREEYAVDNTRPPHIQDKTGVSGERITIVANYFELLSKPQWVVHQYHVDFAPIVESPRIRRGLMASHKETLGSCYLFDGMSDLKTITKLENKVTELYSQRASDGETIRITLKHVAELPPNHPELGRLFNTQMRRNLQHLDFLLLGRHYFDKKGISEVPEFKLQIWQGIITSIRQQEEKLMMLVDTVHKVVRKDTALDIIGDIINRNPKNYHDIVAKELVGAIVMTMYNNRTYRIEDIAWDMNPTMTFEAKGSHISYVEYYKKQYEINVRDLRQPLLLCTSKEREVRGGQRESKKIFLLPEISCMTGLTDSMRSNYHIMKELGMHTKLDPSTRIKNLMHFIDRVNSNPKIQQEMDAWKLRFSQELVTFPARVLPPESIIQGSHKYNYDNRTADFTAEMRGKPMHVPKNLRDWIVICTKNDRTKCSDFLTNLAKVCPPMGMSLGEPKVVYIDNDRVSSYVQALRECRGPNTSIVVFIVPNNKKDRYDALKKNTCIDFPIPSQVVVAQTLIKKNRLMSVATKIAIQMNCKLGGEAWAVEIPLKMGVMVIGYDTYHDSSRKGRSAGAFVASLNSTFTRWYSRVSFHSTGGWQELSDHLKVNLTEALRKYQQMNRALPSMILFFRDGVGDGQVRYVREWEVAQFENTIKEVMEAPETDLQNMKTRFAFVIVNKRINTRFFAKYGPRHNNPLPGTVVDSVVTRYDRYDFFLVPQSVKEGTVAPTMFNVIADRSGLKPEYMQRLSYKLTHLYYNFSGTIRVPAPCQYAHKLAFLTGQSLHREPAEELLDKLFYL